VPPPHESPDKRIDTDNGMPSSEYFSMAELRSLRKYAARF
jgi:hypothetical protein